MHHKVVGLVVELHELQPVGLAPLLVGRQSAHVFQADTLIHLSNPQGVKRRVNERQGKCWVVGVGGGGWARVDRSGDLPWHLPGL